MTRFLTIIFLIKFTVFLSAQNTDSIPNKTRGGAEKTIDTTLSIIKNDGIKIDTTNFKPDSLVAKSDKKLDKFFKNFFKKDYPNPRKAALISLILPGSGQIYNKSYWKLPLVYGSLAGTIWWEIYNVDYHRELKTAYFNKVNNLPQEIPKYENYDATSIKFARDEVRKRTEFAGLLLGLNVLLITAEAFTDAHLKHFDVSDDLSLQVKPSIFQINSGMAAAGFGLKFSF